MTDLWEELKNERRPIFLYGMGDGADKLLAVCQKKGVRVSGVFCSNGFARGKVFRGMPVKDYEQTCAETGDFAVLLAFGSAREDVIGTIGRVAHERTLYIPDLPVAGKALFDGAFYKEHEKEFGRARALFADERSRTVFDAVIRAKLYGRIEDFFVCTSTLDADFADLLHPDGYQNCVDLGAYDGDSARFLAGHCRNIGRIFAFEPDEKTFARLQKKTAGLPITAFPFAAWDKDEELTFARGGNRGSGVKEGEKTATVRGVKVDRILDGARVDFIKFDVEGAEKRALEGLRETIARSKPEMLISCYHRPEDLYELPLYIAERYPFYKLYLRRRKCLPAWEIGLYCTK